jgi:hypothetical protein
MSRILTVIFLVEEILHFSRRSNDLSVDLAASLTSVVSRVAVDRCVDLSIQPAEVVFVENSYFISLFFIVLRNIFIIARRAVVGFLQLVEDFG